MAQDHFLLVGSRWAELLNQKGSMRVRHRGSMYVRVDKGFHKGFFVGPLPLVLFR